jgi:ribosomal protein S1
MGSIFEARVLNVSNETVVVDYGGESEGTIPQVQFDQEVEPGDVVEVYVDPNEGSNKSPDVSREKVESARLWTSVESAYENGEIVEGEVVRHINAGLIVELFNGELEAFLPGSQIGVHPVRDFDSLLGERMELRIVKLNRDNDNIVVSHREVIENELGQQSDQILSELEVGQIVEGTVKNIVDFGAFIDLGGVDALLPTNDLSWGRVSHPSEVVELGQELEVVVLEYDQERERISVGLKQLQDDPRENIGEKYDEGEVVVGKVVGMKDYGAFVELEEGVEGLLHNSEMSWTQHVKHPSQMVSLGQHVDVKILNVDDEEKKISLGMKQLEPDPWEGVSDRYSAGTVLAGTVCNIVNFGVFVEIEPGIEGLVHVSDLSWTKKVQDPGDMIDEGQELDVVILDIDEEERRISLGRKQTRTNPWGRFADVYEEDTDTESEVVRVEDEGLVVELPLGVEAFVPGTELENGPQNFENFYHEGDELDLRVIQFDKDEKEIVLTETHSQEKSDSPETVASQRSGSLGEPDEGPAQDQNKEPHNPSPSKPEEDELSASSLSQESRWEEKGADDLQDATEIKADADTQTDESGLDDHEEDQPPTEGKMISPRTQQECRCGSEKIEVVGDRGNLRRCKKCRRTWYVNHCWNCSQHIDSRADDIDECQACGWYRCPNCGACEWECEGKEPEVESPDQALESALGWKTDGSGDGQAGKRPEAPSSDDRDDQKEEGGTSSADDSHDGFLHLQLTTTGAEQLIQSIDNSARIPENDHRCRETGEQYLYRYADDADGAHVSKMEDTGQESEHPLTGLRIQHEDASVSMVLARKESCMLLIGARREQPQEHAHEVEVDLKMSVGGSGTPPISDELWDRILDLETRKQRHEEVERRLKQWKAYLQVQKEEAEKQQFEAEFGSIRHLDQIGRLRLGLNQRSRRNQQSKLKQSQRDRVSLYTEHPEDGHSQRAIAQAEVVRYDESQHCLIIDLLDDDVKRLEKDRLRIPPEGWVQHKAIGTLSMIHRQEQAIQQLKQTGGAMENLDLFLFGSDEEIDPPPFGPVEPIPESECLDPEHTNRKQRLAVANALECPDMFFLQGPPGTGKTTFIAELCYQLGKRGKRALVASQANLAVDNALGRLQESRDILAVRVARENKVEDEGKPFIGENAVRTWLRGVANHARGRIQNREGRNKAAQLADTNRDELGTWIQEASTIDSKVQELEEKQEQYREEASSLQEAAEESRVKADSLRSLSDSLQPDALFQDVPNPTQSDRAEGQSAWEQVSPSIQRLWDEATEQVREMTDQDVRDPWEVSTALHQMDHRLESGNEIANLVKRAQEVLEEVGPLRKRVESKLSDLREAKKRLQTAKRTLRRERAALDNAPEIDDIPLYSAEIDSQRYPTLRAAALRASQAHSLHAGRRSRQGDSPERSARKLAADWKNAEVAGREDDAQHLLQKLHVALTKERERASMWGIGWIFKMWLSGTLDQVESAIQSVEKCIVGEERSNLTDAIEREVRHRRSELRQAVADAEGRVDRLSERVESLEKHIKKLNDEAGVISDRLRSRFGPLLSEDDYRGDIPAERFLQITNALAEFPDRLEKLRNRVSREREHLQNVLRNARDRVYQEASRYDEEADEQRANAARRERTVASLEERIQELHRRHSDARDTWSTICAADPALSEEAAHRIPSEEWLDEYIDTLDEMEVERIRKEKQIVQDWEGAIDGGAETISEGLKDRFYRHANVVGATCARTGKKDFRNEYGVFDVVIVDEVSKATPTELLMPSLLGSTVALVGDHKQLAPVFGHQSNFEAAAERLNMEEDNLQENLRRSLFKERFEQFSEVDEEKMVDPEDGEGTDTQERPGRRTVMLTKQYRMHSQIMEGINQFYGGKLELGEIREDGNVISLDELRNHGLETDPWVDEDHHLVWVDTPVGADWEHTQEGPTRYNEKEMGTTLQMLQSVADRFRKSESFDLSVGVTSVYAAQVQRLRRRVQQMSIPERMKKDLKISTVDRFQGMERDVMFLNLVLNRRNHPPSKWLRTPERINVAMSRARRLLVIVGSKHNYVEVEGTSPAYHKFFDVARKYGHYVRANLVLD